MAIYKMHQFDITFTSTIYFSCKGELNLHTASCSLVTFRGGILSPTTLARNINCKGFVSPGPGVGVSLGCVEEIQGVPYYWARFVFVIFLGSRAHTEELFIAIG